MPHKNAFNAGHYIFSNIIKFKVLFCVNMISKKKIQKNDIRLEIRKQ